MIVAEIVPHFLGSRFPADRDVPETSRGIIIEPNDRAYVRQSGDCVPENLS